MMRISRVCDTDANNGNVDIETSTICNGSLLSDTIVLITLTLSRPKQHWHFCTNIYDAIKSNKEYSFFGGLVINISLVLSTSDIDSAVMLISSTGGRISLHSFNFLLLENDSNNTRSITLNDIPSNSSNNSSNNNKDD